MFISNWIFYWLPCYWLLLNLNCQLTVSALVLSWDISMVYILLVQRMYGFMALYWYQLNHACFVDLVRLRSLALLLGSVLLFVAILIYRISQACKTHSKNFIFFFFRSYLLYLIYYNCDLFILFYTKFPI